MYDFRYFSNKSCISFLLTAIFLLAPHAALADNKLTRKTNEGSVTGFKSSENTISWHGIPYATAPVGDLRWKAPRPPTTRQHPLIANDNSSLCSQLGGPMTTMNVFKWNAVIGKEDCLHLNITAPEAMRASAKLPVMFWIHGGGNSIGYKGNAAYGGEQLSHKGQVVVVSINYRLGPLGWFYHPALNESYTDIADRSGNYGTLDIIQALTWVRDNIEYFGGDPANVTVFGESAGGFNVYTLMISPLAKGLFHRAIVQSGGLQTITTAFASGLSVKNNENSDQLIEIEASSSSHPFNSAYIVNQILIDNAYVKTVDEGRIAQTNMPTEDIRKILYSENPENLLKRYPTRAAGMLQFPGMFKDGYVLPHEEPIKLFDSPEKINSVPIILGTNRDENKVFMALDRNLVNWRFQIRNPEHYHRTARYLSDNWKINGVDKFANLLAKHQTETFAYRFDWDELPTIMGVNLSELIGAGHGLEIPFVFGSLQSDVHIHLLFGAQGKEKRQQLSDAMLAYWVQFAYTGNPERGLHNNLPLWQAWNSQKQAEKFIVLDTGEGAIRMSPDSLTERMLKKRLANDKTFTNKIEKCQLYQALFIPNEFQAVDVTAYNKFNKGICVDVPLKNQRL